MNEGGLNSLLRGSSLKSFLAFSLVVVTSLTLLKLVIGLITQSLSLVSGALDSAVDVVVVIVVFLAVEVAEKPADHDYHYGRGKVENFSAFLVSLLLMASSGWIFYEALQRILFKGIGVEVNLWTFLVAGASIAASVTFYRLFLRAAEFYGSQVFEAGALNFATSVWSSATVVVGLLVTRLSQVLGVKELALGDAAAAMVVAAIVVWVSFKIGRSAVEVLLDKAPRGIAEQLKKAISAVRGVEECRRVRVRRSGNRYFVDATILLKPTLPLARANKVVLEVERIILSVLPGADVVIDTDPHTHSRCVADRIKEIAMENGLSVHGLTVRNVNGRLHVDVHMELPPEVSVEEASRLADTFKDIVKGEIPDVEEVNIHLEALEDDVVKSSESTVSEELLSEVRRAVESFHVKFPRCDVEVKSYDEEPIIYVTIYVDGSMPIGKAYEISSDLKDHIFRNVPLAEDVMIDVRPLPVESGKYDSENPEKCPDSGVSEQT